MPRNCLQAADLAAQLTSAAEEREQLVRTAASLEEQLASAQQVAAEEQRQLEARAEALATELKQATTAAEKVC